VVFASCIVGALTVRAGAEPTGLVISCLLGGASSVVAGVIEVHAGVADRLCAALTARLLHGQHPADALRDAQLAFIESRDTASAHRWAGYICISRLPAPAPNDHSPNFHL
jgi:CHAT domain-containing protein